MLRGAILQTLSNGEGRSSPLADKAPLGPELHQASDGREDQMELQLEPPHTGTPAALILGKQSHGLSVINATVGGTVWGGVAGGPPIG